MNYTFLITYFAHPELLAICLDSIRRYHPGVPIIISQENNDAEVDIGDTRLLRHNMADVQWVGVAEKLVNNCNTDIGIFMEHDCFLLKSLDDLLSKMDKYDLIGPEEVIPELRDSPGFICQNFFITNIKKLKDIGIHNVHVRDIEDLKKLELKNIESGYGISQTFDKKLFLPVKRSRYAYGTYYGDYVHHLWYGSYRRRDTMYLDNIPRQWMEEETQRLIKDYWNNDLKNLPK